MAELAPEVQQTAPEQPAAQQPATTHGSGLQSIIESLGVPPAPQQPLSVEAHDPQGTLIAGVYG